MSVFAYSALQRADILPDPFADRLQRTQLYFPLGLFCARYIVFPFGDDPIRFPRLKHCSGLATGRSIARFTRSLFFCAGDFDRARGDRRFGEYVNRRRFGLRLFGLFLAGERFRFAGIFYFVFLKYCKKY